MITCRSSLQAHISENRCLIYFKCILFKLITFKLPYYYLLTTRLLNASHAYKFRYLFRKYTKSTNQPKTKWAQWIMRVTFHFQRWQIHAFIISLHVCMYGSVWNVFIFALKLIIILIILFKLYAHRRAPAYHCCFRRVGGLQDGMRARFG